LVQNPNYREIRKDLSKRLLEKMKLIQEPNAIIIPKRTMFQKSLQKIRK
jgi:hypothetical protein